jgi:hypothetical protein
MMTQALRGIDDAEAGAKARDDAVRREAREKPKRPPMRRMEFDLPPGVCVRLKTEAMGRGVSANRVMLENLRKLGYPVTDEDLIDGRKGPRA